MNKKAVRVLLTAFSVYMGISPIKAVLLIQTINPTLVSEINH